MKRDLKFSCLLAALLTASYSHAAEPQRFANIGDLQLVSGEVIEDCSIGYRVYGQPNDDRSNVIVIPTWFTGTTAGFDAYGQIGAGRLADTDT